MSLEYTILGFLNIQPFSGYDLKKHFDHSIRHFWPADQAQIYRTLARLTENGLAEMEVIHQEDRPDRKVYHITEDGRRGLLQWLKSPQPMHETRSAELIQIFFAGELSEEDALAIFERHAHQLRTILEIYGSVPHDVSDGHLDSCEERVNFFRLLTLECGMELVQAELAWTDTVIERLINSNYTLRLRREGKGENHAKG